jgi:anti-sigma factor RsiW
MVMARDWHCTDFQRVIHGYVDVELDAGTLVDAEHHVASCETCRERVALARALRGSLQRTARGASAPEGLRARLGVATAAEANRAANPALTRDASGLGESRGPFVRSLALAAAVALLFVGARSTSLTGTRHAQHASLGADLLTDLVSEHSRPLPFDATDPKKVRMLEQYVGVPVHANTSRFEKTGAHFVGGRVLPVHHERAAMLQYELGQGEGARRVSVFVFDPKRIHLNDSELSHRTIGTADVRVGRSRGYTVAVTERAGVGYAVAGDLDPDRSAELALLADAVSSDD